MATKRENFTKVKEVLSATDFEGKEELLEFVDHEIDLLSRKSSKTSPAAIHKAAENAERMDVVYDCLVAADRAVTVTELQKSFPEELSVYSTPRMTYLLGALCNAGKAINTREKGTSYYTAVVE